jgi:uncharacterized membrane protein YfcA
MSPLTVLLVALGAFTLFYVVVIAVGVKRAGAEQGATAPTPLGIVIGFVTNFFDALGIGSFATTTTAFRATRMVPDEQIPGTLNAGHTLPTIAQAFVFITIVQVEFQTLLLLILAAIIGSWFGAGVVARWSRRKVQIGMGTALFIAAMLYALKSIDEMRAVPVFPGGEALGLTGVLLGVAIVGNLMLGALMTLGIGLYAPCLIMLSLLGMEPRAAFPIMMGACAFLMPVASARFVKERRFHARAVMGLMIGGIGGSLLAALWVKQMNLTTVRWLVVIVVTYTAVSMLRTAARERAAAGAPAGAAGPR